MQERGGGGSIEQNLLLQKKSMEVQKKGIFFWTRGSWN
jgi:hypothetical protein